MHTGSSTIDDSVSSTAPVAQGGQERAGGQFQVFAISGFDRGWSSLDRGDPTRGVSAGLKGLLTILTVDLREKS